MNCCDFITKSAYKILFGKSLPRTFFNSIPSPDAGLEDKKINRKFINSVPSVLLTKKKTFGHFALRSAVKIV